MVLISAGVGATPVLAMLHVVAAERSGRHVWWLHGARNSAEHSFERETRALLEQLPHAHRIVCCSHPGPNDRGFDLVGRLTGEVLDQAGVPTDADFYLCGPGQFMHDTAAALIARGVAPDRLSTEVCGPSDPQMPGIVGASERAPHPPPASRARVHRVSFSRSNLSVAWDPAFANLLELAEACDVPSGGHAEPASATSARRGLSAARSGIGLTHWSCLRRVMR